MSDGTTQIKLAIVVGHSYTAKGAYGVYPLLPEYDFNSMLAEMIYQIAKERGLGVRVFRRDGIGVKGVYRNVKDWARSDLTVCVELHFNSFNGKVRGTETLYDNDPKESKDFAEIIHKCVCEALSRKDKTDRGLKLISDPKERGYTNLNECKIPSVILEPVFGDNKEDAALLYDRKKQYALAIVDSTIKYLNSLKT